jgi:transketolase
MANASTQELANAIRALSMDAVEKAQSGHPGMPMGMADIATVLWQEFLHHCPTDPTWLNRDRFVLSNGHGAMLQYALLHLSGYALSIEDIKNFRQLHSLTAGHPENHTPGIETTTGPLGQGLANAVGMAIAEKQLAATFNRSGFDLLNHWTYVFLGDGCLMEGVSHEVCSLAGTLGLSKLIAFWDDNRISIDGDVDTWFTDNTPERFRAYGWNVITEVDGHDAQSIRQAITQAKQELQRPTLICCRTTIGYGAPNKAGTADCHGAPLGAAEIKATREKLGWTYPPFEIPDHIYATWDAKEAGEKRKRDWEANFKAYAQKYPDLAVEWQRRMTGQLPANFQALCAELMADTQKEAKAIATRKASQQVIAKLAPHMPEMLGGSADLTGSNLTDWPGCQVMTHTSPGQYLHYGVREFGMASIMNGISLYGGFHPFGGTFLTFLDYMRSAVRMSALMSIPVVYVLTHDSIGLGEDGPTHQPVEHFAMLRATPNVSLWRPADTMETIVAWRAALERKTGPTCLALSRQGLPALERTPEQIQDIAKGGYILKHADSPQLVLVSTGSEVSICVEAHQRLTQQGLRVQVVSLPCWDVFDAQSEAYKQHVLPDVPCLAVEAASPMGWAKYFKGKGKIIAVETFGLSAPCKQVYEHFGITVDNIVAEANKMV